LGGEALLVEFEKFDGFSRWLLVRSG
jgi:hypothetical protein